MASDRVKNNVSLVVERLCSKGYRLFGSHKGDKNTQVEYFDVYGSSEGTLYILQVYKGDSGFNVYKEVTYENSLQAVLNAIE